MQGLYRMKRARFLLLVGILIWIVSGYVPIRASEGARAPDHSEVRALWVDAFHDGIKTPAQVDQLVRDSLDANINTLIVQVRRRGDAYYNRSIEPRTEDPNLQPGFDALQYLIEKAHANHIEVHAWLNTLVAWNSQTPPQDPNHVWNLHGPQATGNANWISYSRTYNSTTKSWSDTLNSSYFLDPGNPEVVDYTVAVYLNVVKNYQVDGIHLDYSRYAGLGWGYNPTSVARYNAQFGTAGLPEPDDPQWLQWRREQTANLVRKIYLKAIAVRPEIKVSSAVITWGEGPVAETDWEKTRAYAQVCQDWEGWLKEGIIDMAVPMNYYGEWNSAQQLWYNQWIEWEKNHQYGRWIVIGPGVFMQYIEQALEQIRRAQGPSSQGNHGAGVALYAYGQSNLYGNDDYSNAAASKGLPRQPHAYHPEAVHLLFPLLSREGGYTEPLLHTFISTQPVFPERAAIPDMPWKSHPTSGYLMGSVAAGTPGKTVDHLKVTVDSWDAASQPAGSADPGTHRVAYTDGSGWYGLAEIPPGHYLVSLDKNDGTGPGRREVWIQPGLVSEVNF